LPLPPKNYDEPSVFSAENLLREARRQKSKPSGSVPKICLLDPDGDIVRCLLADQRAVKCSVWACYHTDLYLFELEGLQIGVLGCAVGASFAVLVAEELFASGCELLISITSAGQITALRDPPYFVLIEKALRDEGTSYHYLPPSDYSGIDEKLMEWLEPNLKSCSLPVEIGSTWTTDAPFRETTSAIDACRNMGLVAVEMEAAALYAFARAQNRPIICFAHVTNQMASIEGDFEKGAENGSRDALRLVATVARLWQGLIKPQLNQAG
jgi:uridine phosphorylase